MESITSLNPKSFSAYLSDTHNTICGRHPIAVLLNVSAHQKKSLILKVLLRVILLLSSILSGGRRPSIVADGFGVYNEVCAVRSV